MVNFRTFFTSLFCVALFSLPAAAQGLARYRDFQFGMSLETVAKQVQMNASDAKTTHRRPALIQTLQWDQFRNTAAAAKAGPVRNIRFDFYNDELSKIVVTYDSAGTDGLTTADIIEAISAIYGPATRPQRTIAVVTLGAFQNNEEVLAAWEDAQYSYNLFRSPYGNTFGLVALSRRLDLMATVSSRESVRLDGLEAREKELARQMKQDEEKRAAEEKARLITKPKFRP